MAHDNLFVNEKPLKLEDCGSSYQADKNERGNQFYSLTRSTHKDEIPLEDEPVPSIFKIEILNPKGQISELQEKCDYVFSIKNHKDKDTDRIALQKKFLFDIQKACQTLQYQNLTNFYS